MKKKQREVVDDLKDSTLSVPASAIGAISDKFTENLTKQAYNWRRVNGFPTGIKMIDTRIGGLKVGSLTVIGATTGTGKSVFGINLLVNLNRDYNLPVVYIDLENGLVESVERLVKIWHGDLLPEDFFTNERYKEDFKRMADDFDTFTYLSHTEIKNKTKDKIIKIVSYYADQGHKIFLIDPLQLVPAKDLQGFEKQKQMADAIDELKSLAQSKDLVIVVLHHIRKVSSDSNNYVTRVAEVQEPKIRIPTIDDLRGSGEIGDSSTGAWVLARNDNAKNEKDRNMTLLRVVKNRFGAKADVVLEFNPKTLIFRERTIDDDIKELNDLDPLNLGI